jgi:Papain family cysteine protease.
VRGGFSVVVAGDMSEPGYSIGPPGIAVVPTWDLPSEYIDEAARAFRFANGSTTDDHGLHVVGVTNRKGKDWFLVKDSWSSSWNNDHPGYYFFHEDYVKLKMLAFLVHRDAVKELLARVKKG